MPDRSRLLLYDFLLTKGGAEYVTLLLKSQFKDLDVCVASFNSDEFSEDELFSIRLLSQRHTLPSPALRALSTIRLFKQRTAFISAYNMVVYSGMYAPLAIHKHSGKHNLLYCHTTPPPFAYDWLDFYLEQYSTWQRPLFLAYCRYFRNAYAAAVKKMDVLIANSDYVRRRYLDYFGKNSIVIYPPCDTEEFKWIDQKDFYLSTARHEPHKRVDIIINAFRRLPNKHLIVASNGSQTKNLRALAVGADNIEFVGTTSRKDLQLLIGQCTATIYIGKDEHFGITPVESMAAGKPVISVAEGGLTETVLHQQTGLFLPKPTVEHLITAINILEPQRALEMRYSCQHQAKNFDKSIFLRKINDLLNIT
ncbi:MAG: glycosyltransferase [Gammaproteobacteria bacterium]|nr:glycosyltransferase [Gammaproteobacteria bacterium]MCP5425708.1 glycosyltransferase [Gammaproteobacteria bacterium]